MSDALNVAREVAQQYAEQTNRSFEVYYKQTSSALKDMSVSVGEMAKSVQATSEQLARYEERQAATAERMERLDENMRELGVTQRAFETKTHNRIKLLETQVHDNNTVRKGLIWFGSLIIAGIISSGVLFSNYSAKQPSQPTKTEGQ